MRYNFEYLSPYVPISWTKRFVRHRPTSLRNRLKRLKQENCVSKRPFNILMIELLKAKRKPFNPHKPQRRNYNKVYGRMQIPV